MFPGSCFGKEAEIQPTTHTPPIYQQIDICMHTVAVKAAESKSKKLKPITKLVEAVPLVKSKARAKFDER
jgi:hypothetical protein